MAAYCYAEDLHQSHHLFPLPISLLSSVAHIHRTHLSILNSYMEVAIFRENDWESHLLSKRVLLRLPYYLPDSWRCPRRSASGH